MDELRPLPGIEIGAGDVSVLRGRSSRCDRTERRQKQADQHEQSTHHEFSIPLAGPQHAPPLAAFLLSAYPCATHKGTQDQEHHCDDTEQ